MAVTSLWTKQTGPGSVAFTDATNPDSPITLGSQGTYLLRLTATDGVDSVFDEVLITVRPPIVTFTTPPPDSVPFPIPNPNPPDPPEVDPSLINGVDIVCLLSTGLDFYGSISEGTLLWSKVSGPGSVVFSSPTTVETHVTFGNNGIYQLRISTLNGSLFGRYDIIVAVLDADVLPIANPVL